MANPVQCAVASIRCSCETARSVRFSAMKKNGTETSPANESPTSQSESAEIIDRAQLQADVARQRVRLAKDELRRARKRLKEAKREARRARKYASLARKDWKRARRQAEKEGSAESRQAGVAARTTPKPKARAGSAPVSRRRTATKRTRRTSKAKPTRAKTAGKVAK